MILILVTLTSYAYAHVKLGADVHEIYLFGKDVLAFLLAHGIVIRRHKAHKDD